MGPNGDPQLVIREGGTIEGRQVRRFAVLSAVRGSTAHARSHNGAEHLLILVDFADRTQSIVEVELP